MQVLGYLSQLDRLQSTMTADEFRKADKIGLVRMLWKKHRRDERVSHPELSLIIQLFYHFHWATLLQRVERPI